MPSRGSSPGSGRAGWMSKHLSRSLTVSMTLSHLFLTSLSRITWWRSLACPAAQRVPDPTIHVDDPDTALPPQPREERGGRTDPAWSARPERRRTALVPGSTATPAHRGSNPDLGLIHPGRPRPHGEEALNPSTQTLDPLPDTGPAPVDERFESCRGLPVG